MPTIHAVDQGFVTEDVRAQHSLALDLNTRPRLLKVTTKPPVASMVLMSARVDAKHLSAAMHDTRMYFGGALTFSIEVDSFHTITHTSKHGELCMHFNHMEHKYGEARHPFGCLHEPDAEPNPELPSKDLVYRVCMDACTSIGLQDRVRFLEDKLRLKKYELQLKDYEIRLLKASLRSLSAGPCVDTSLRSSPQAHGPDTNYNIVPNSNQMPYVSAP